MSSDALNTSLADPTAQSEGPVFPLGIDPEAWLQRALLSCAEMAQAEQEAMSSGLSGFELMQAAGRLVADAVMSRYPAGRIIVLCGPGNNGGDGFIAASALAEKGREVALACSSNVAELQGDAAKAAALWDRPVLALSPDALNGFDIVVDAIFGAGLSRAPEGDVAKTLGAIGSRQVVAVDVPSGVSGDTGLSFKTALNKADTTVTFFREKTGHYLMPGRIRSGEIILGDIGIAPDILSRISPETALNGSELWCSALPRVTPESHKYSRGTVLITGGPEMIGAACLASRAAQRSGAGLVRVASPVQQSSLYKLSLESAIVHAVKDTRAYLELLEDTRTGCIVIGPGLGIDSPGAHEKVLAVMRGDIPAVLDADALSLSSRDPSVLFERGRRGKFLLTPHEGEFAKLFPDLAEMPSKLDRAIAAAERVGSPIILKGFDTVVADPSGHAVINANAPATLATAGAGDVLCGIAAALIAGGMPIFAAACAAVHLHGAAAQRYGPGLIASDLPALLPVVIDEIFLTN